MLGLPPLISGCLAELLGRGSGASKSEASGSPAQSETAGGLPEQRGRIGKWEKPACFLAELVNTENVGFARRDISDGMAWCLAVDPKPCVSSMY